MRTLGLFLTQRLRSRENQLFLVLTILIGIIAGLAAVLFTLAIQSVQYFFFGVAPSPRRLVLVPTAVSLVTGVLLAKFFPDAGGSGIPQTEAAYHLEEGTIPARVPLGKFLTGVLCVGSGHSLGREGPAVQIGAGLASVIGRWFRLSPNRIRDLVPIGGAAALSAAFNTPVSAVLFALEEIIGDLNAAAIGSAVVASVTSVIIARAILGNDPLLHMPAYHLTNPGELLGYAVLGVVGGVVSAIFCKGLLYLRAAFLRMPRWTLMFQPAIGGLAVGIILIFVPQVMGVGYEYVDQALSGSLVLKTLIVLCLVKLAATVLSYSSGNAGGIFAPSLFLGAMAGGAIGIVLQRLVPFATSDPGTYALVGMGVTFAGIIRAPMTSVFMIFELTQDYQILVPLMIANMLSFLISRQFQRQPIYHALLAQNHIYLPGPNTRSGGGSWRAKDVMSDKVELLAPDTSIQSAWEATRTSGEHGYMVGEDGSLEGVVSLGALESAVVAKRAKDPIRTLLAEQNWAHVHPDHPLEIVLERLTQNSGILPVLHRSGLRRIVGVITKDSILRVLENSRAKATTS